MNISDLYICKCLVREEIGDPRLSESELLRIAKALQRSIRPLVQRELSEPTAKRKGREGEAHAES